MLTLEQQDFWNQLKFDAQYFAHVCGNDMKGKSIKSLNELGSNYLYLAMHHLSTEDLVSVVKTWLNYYHLDLDPSKLGDVFDKFHTKCGDWIVKNGKNIKMIGCQ